MLNDKKMKFMETIKQRTKIKVTKCDYKTGEVEYTEYWTESDFETGKVIRKYTEECEDEIYDLQACINLEFCNTDVYDTPKKQQRWWEKEFAPDFLMGYYDTLI